MTLPDTTKESPVEFIIKEQCDTIMVLEPKVEEKILIK